jgi:hypothetical protein
MEKTMKSFMKVFALVAMSMSLIACSGGSSSGGSGDGNPKNLIDGDFLSASSTSAEFLIDRSGNGRFGDHCVGEDKYFETKDSRIRVYGSPSFSSTDFKVVATFIDQHLDSVLSRFGMTWEEFVAQRQLLTGDHMETLLRTYIKEDGTVVPELEDGYDSWTIKDEAITLPLWNAKSESEKLDAIEQVYTMLQATADKGIYIGETSAPQFQDKDRVVACLNPSMRPDEQSINFGEGTRFGLAVAGQTSSYRNDAGTIIRHELVHFVQENLTRTAGRTKTLPRWFSEGQAIVFAGQSHFGPSRHYDFSPVNVVNATHETGIATDDAYKHYGLAYKYLNNHNSKESMLAIMTAMRDENPNPFNFGIPDDLYGNFTPGFTNAFDAGMIDHNGESLTFQDYKDNYHDIMNTQY